MPWNRAASLPPTRSSSSPTRRRTSWQLHVFSPTGEFLRSIGANGTQPGQFKSTCGVTYIGAIIFFVAEYVGRRVRALETDGTPLQVCSSSLGPVCSSLAPAVRARPLAYASDAPLPRLRASQVLPVVDATSLYDLCVVRPQPRTASCTLYVTSAPLAPPRNWHRSAIYHMHAAHPHRAHSSEGVHPCCRHRDRGAARAEPRDGAADCVSREGRALLRDYSPLPLSHMRMRTCVLSSVCTLCS